MLQYEECFQIIENEIKNLNYTGEAQKLYDPINYTLNIGGKRLRPCLSLMSHNIFSDDIRNNIFPALALEVFHNFTLLHDDIMDNSSLRRNHPTVHKKWNKNTAILSGDAMMILAYQLLSQTPEKYFHKVLALFNQTALEVCEGQQLDMDYEQQNMITVDQYIKMIRLKTAVLIAAALSMGAITGESSENDAQNLYQCGLHIGLAFQLQDDYLDVFGNTHRTGKKIGGDITANKKTYLLIAAMNSTDKTLINELKNWIQKKTFNPEDKIRSITEIFRKLKIEEESYNLTLSYFDQAIKYLHKIEIQSQRKQQLEDLFITMKKRDY